MVVTLGQTIYLEVNQAVIHKLRKEHNIEDLKKVRNRKRRGGEA